MAEHAHTTPDNTPHVKQVTPTRERPNRAPSTPALASAGVGLDGQPLFRTVKPRKPWLHRTPKRRELRRAMDILRLASPDMVPNDVQADIMALGRKLDRALGGTR